MDFRHRGYGGQEGEEQHHHHHHGGQEGEEQHHHHHHGGQPVYEGERYPHHPNAPDAYPSPYPHPSYAHEPPYPPIPTPTGPYDNTHTPTGPYGSHTPTHAPPYAHTPAGPYATHTPTHPPPYGTHTPTHPPPYAHTPAGPYGTHTHEPPFEAFPSEPSHAPLLPQGQIVRVFCKGNPSFNLAVEHDTVIMKPANSQDESQQWIKDSTYGMRVKDNYGHSAFTLVNKKSQKILRHSKEKGQQVLLMDYRPDIRDDDILWSESQDFGEGFKTVRGASDTLLNLTVFEGNKKIRNGSALVLDTWHKGDHQLWKLFAL